MSSEELGRKYIEVLPDDADLTAVRREVTVEQARACGDDGMAAYVLLHYFMWRDDIYCRLCGTQVLPAWTGQHYQSLHRPTFGF